MLRLISHCFWFPMTREVLNKMIIERAKRLFEAKTPIKNEGSSMLLEFNHVQDDGSQGESVSFGSIEAMEDIRP